MSSDNIQAKVAHVLSAGQTRLHHCHWPGCNIQVPPAMWGCRQHWFRLPPALRTEIWQNYKIGQEETGTPSNAYLRTARKVQEWIAAYEHLHTPRNAKGKDLS